MRLRRRNAKKWRPSKEYATVDGDGLTHCRTTRDVLTRSFQTRLLSVLSVTDTLCDTDDVFHLRKRHAFEIGRKWHRDVTPGHTLHWTVQLIKACFHEISRDLEQHPTHALATRDSRSPCSHFSTDAACRPSFFDGNGSVCLLDGCHEGGMVERTKRPEIDDLSAQERSF